MDHEHVRRSFTCIRCNGIKDTGLLLCWPCHRAEKRDHDGGYSIEIEVALEVAESRACDVVSRMQG